MHLKEQLQRAILSGRADLIALAQRIIDQRSAEAAAESFKHFVRLCWPLVATSPLVDGWYLDAICEHLQNLPTIKRLVINIPPRHGKSTLVTVLYPAWMWALRPQTKFLCSTYSLKDLSIPHSVLCRQVIESPVYQRNWGHVYTLRADQNTKTRFTTDHQGERIATSVESGNTGQGCDVLLADDLNNVATAQSLADRQNIIAWWQQTMSTRMNPGGLDCKVVIQQRCHAEDITGHILANDTGDWTRLILPWEFEPERRTVTPIWSDPRTTPGEPLSKLYTPEKIAELKGGNGLGPTGFATQFQQRPSPAEGAVFQRHWFKRYQETPTAYVLDGVEVQKDWCRTFISTDLAISLKTQADYTVALVLVVTPHRHLLVTHMFRERVEGPAAVKAFEGLASAYQPDCMLVEDVAFQRLMIQILKQQGLPVRPVTPEGQDKRARSQRAQVMAESGFVWLPSETAWAERFLDEVCEFPNSAHDDIFDTICYGCIRASKYPVRELPREQTAEEVAAERERRRLEFMWGD